MPIMGSVSEELSELVADTRRREDAHICEEELDVLRGRIVDLRLEDVLTCFCF